MQQTDNHLILIQFRLDAQVGELQLVDIQVVERLSLVEQVRHIHIQRIRACQLVRRRLAVSCAIIYIEVIAALCVLIQRQTIALAIYRSILVC